MRSKESSEPTLTAPKPCAAVQMLAALILSSGLTGCLVIGGSRRGGFFLWPGGLGLVLILVLFVLLSRRR